MSLQEGTHASHSAQQVNETVQPTPGTYGPRCLELLAQFDPESHSWKTYGVITLWDLTVCLPTLPKLGMTLNGKLFQRSAWERPILDSGSFVWPTPMASDSHYRLTGNSQASHNLQAMAAKGELTTIWPTPTAHPDNSNKNGKFKNPTLGDAVRMWPTPTTQEVEHPDMKLTPSNRRKSKNGKGSHSLNLADSVRFWPTPRSNSAMASLITPEIANDPKRFPNLETVVGRQMSAGAGGRLNPVWVEWLMGFPLGWTDLEG